VGAVIPAGGSPNLREIAASDGAVRIPLTSGRLAEASGLSRYQRSAPRQHGAELVALVEVIIRVCKSIVLLNPR
jgi:hypothetical protein